MTTVYRLVVTKPEGSEAPGWEPDAWPEVVERLGYERDSDYAPRFRWPTRRNFFSRSAALRRARNLREFGAEVTVEQSKVTAWETLP